MFKNKGERSGREVVQFFKRVMELGDNRTESFEVLNFGEGIAVGESGAFGGRNDVVKGVFMKERRKFVVD